MSCLHQPKEVQFWHLLQPSLYLGFIFGGMHLSLDPNQTIHPFHGSTLGVLWSIAYLGFTFYIAYAFIIYFIQFALYDTLGSSLEDNVVVYTVICSQIVTTGLHIFVSLLKPKQTLMCLNTSYEIFSHLHLKISRRTLEVALTPTIFTAWFLIRSLVVICVHSRIGFPEGLSYIVFFTPIAIEGLAGVLHFTVEVALEGVNDDLEDVRNCLQKEGTDFMTPGHIEVQRLKHKMVCDLAEVVDARFGLDLLAGVTMKIVQVIPLIFFGVLLLDWENLGSEILLVWTHLLFVVSRVCYSCYRYELVKKQTYRTRIILQRLNQSYLDPESKEEIHYFSMQLNSRQIEFTASGFFPLDFTLIYSIVGAVTTYLVILIQFRPNLNHKTGGGVDNYTKTTPTPSLPFS